MKKVDCVAVVLHYVNFEDTVECVESFIENCQDTEIIVVDNASPTPPHSEIGSGKQLYLKYKENPRVTVILNKENLGFSAGNNVGIKYARENFDFSFLILANNDTVILKPFEDTLKAVYEKQRFAVLGPMILTADGRYDSNPLYSEPYKKEKALHDIMYHRQKIKAIKNPFYAFFNKQTKRIKSRFKGRNAKSFKRARLSGEALLKPHEDVVLHGSFLVFSNDYFKAFDGLDARTFLYAEEDILYTHCKNNDLKMYYCPEIQVFHKEDGSTKKVLNTKERALHFSTHAVTAINAYLDLLLEYEKK